MRVGAGDQTQPRPTLVIDGSLDEEPAPCPASTTFSQTQDYITQ